VGNSILEGVEVEDLHRNIAVVAENNEAAHILMLEDENSRDGGIQEEGVAGKQDSVGMAVYKEDSELLVVCMSTL
jgi:hypothetical protein